MPRTTITSLFGTSPVKPLQQHMEAVQICVNELVPFIEAVLEKDWDRAREQQGKISRLEQQADTLKRELRLNLPRSLFMPMSRRDLLEVLRMQDYIANTAKDVAGLMLGRKMEVPELIGADFLGFVKRGIDASRQAQTAINELDELVETGFHGNEVRLVESMIKTLDEIEGDADEIEVRIRAGLLSVEKSLHPVDVIFLYKVIDTVGKLADYAQRVGSRLELMLAR
ncbi:MAG TPA: TIGR00153 family protein [Gammaproteobacteria bacterium]|nr:TIGR00153 family protein [Gammaproteobacteria bacterium]